MKKTTRPHAIASLARTETIVQFVLALFVWQLLTCHQFEIRDSKFFGELAMQHCYTERAKMLQWHYIPEENCILDKETLSWNTADDAHVELTQLGATSDVQ